MIKDAQNLESVHIWSISTIFENMFYFKQHQQSLKIWQSLIANSNSKPKNISILLLKLNVSEVAIFAQSGQVCQFRQLSKSSITDQKQLISDFWI